ncbi:restriction endonuclease subunit S [Acinetobacter sp. NIPH 1869]|nr:restriction endonuclease subunit S [Acinetobacter higginsii]MCH7306505.1 restriction endonuclease subunit S [Acinetobacter higginsii]
MTTPALRFTEFDGDWISSPLKKFFPKIRNGFVGIATPYYVANGVKYLQGKNVKDGRIDPTGLIYISEEFHAKKSNSKLAIDDILMVQSGHVGECAVIDKEYDNANCHALIVLSPHKEQETNSHFVKYYFYTPIGKKIISQIKTGNTIEHVLASEVKEIYLNFPSKVEQTKIASFLSIVDEKIAQLSQKHQLLSQYKEGMMQKLFSQQIRFKADDGSEFEEWEITTLGLTGKFIGGGTPSKKVTEFWQGSIPWISSSDLVDESIFNINITRFISTEALNQSATKLIPANSILIVSRVGVGKVAVTDKDICTSQDFTNLVLNSGNTVFFGYLIKSLTGRLLEMNQGTSIKGFVKDD